MLYFKSYDSKWLKLNITKTANLLLFSNTLQLQTRNPSTKIQPASTSQLVQRKSFVRDQALAAEKMHKSTRNGYFRTIRLKAFKKLAIKSIRQFKQHKLAYESYFLLQLLQLTWFMTHLAKYYFWYEI